MIKVNLAFHGITLAKIGDFNYLLKHIHNEYFWFIDRYEDSPQLRRRHLTCSTSTR